jgi:acyl carrier protein
MNNIEDFLKKLVSTQLGVPVNQIQNDSKFIEELGGDSLDTVEMILILEDKLKIDVPEEIAEEMYDIQSVLNYLKSINFPEEIN